jgi:hypothetical protein
MTQLPDRVGRNVSLVLLSVLNGVYSHELKVRGLVCDITGLAAVSPRFNLFAVRTAAVRATEFAAYLL